MSMEKIMGKILQDADAEAKAVIEAAEREADLVRAAAVAEAGKVQQHAIASGRKEVDLETARIRAQAEMASRKLLRRAREEVVAECFAAAEQELARVRASPQYGDILVRLMESAVAQIGGESVALLTSSQDQELVRGLAAARGAALPVLSISDEEIATAGGVIVRSATGHVEVENTFEERLLQLRSELLFAVARVLEGKEGGG
jgi:V/A-type H+-transporting ATPase subunit E